METVIVTNKDLMSKARESLKGKWGLSIGGTLLYLVIIIGVQTIPVIGKISTLIIYGAMTLGFNTFILAISRNEDANISQVFDGFKKFGVALAAYLLQMLFIILWTLLLIIPGIVAAYSYAMTFYILADNKNIGPLEAIRKSKEMMRGHKWRFLCLSFRFIGWTILCVFTLGIGLLWLIPYMSVSVAQFYNSIKESQVVSIEADVQA